MSRDEKLGTSYHSQLLLWVKTLLWWNYHIELWLYIVGSRLEPSDTWLESIMFYIIPNDCQASYSQKCLMLPPPHGAWVYLLRLSGTFIRALKKWETACFILSPTRLWFWTKSNYTWSKCTLIFPYFGWHVPRCGTLHLWSFSHSKSFSNSALHRSKLMSHENCQAVHFWRTLLQHLVRFPTVVLFRIAVRRPKAFVWGAMRHAIIQVSAYQCFLQRKILASLAGVCLLVGCFLSVSELFLNFLWQIRPIPTKSRV